MKIRTALLVYLLLNSICYCEIMWESSNLGLDNLKVLSIAIDTSGTLYAGTYGDGIYRSDNNGNTWININNGISLHYISEIAIDLIGTVYISNRNGDNEIDNANHIYVSYNKGEEWNELNVGLPDTNIFTVTALEVDNNNIPWIGYMATIYGATTTTYGYLYKYSKENNQWYHVDSILTPAESITFDVDNNIYLGGGVLLAGNELKYSTDNGNIFSNISLPNNSSSAGEISNIFINDYGDIYLSIESSPRGVFMKKKKESMWEYLSLDLPYYGYRFNDLIFRSNNYGDLFLALGGYNYDIIDASNLEVYRSSDNGDNWTNISQGLTNKDIRELAIDKTGIIYVATFGGGIFRSTWAVPIKLMEFRVE